MAIAGAIIAVAGLAISHNRAKKAERKADQQRRVDERAAELTAARGRRIQFAEARKKQQALIARQEALGFQGSGAAGQVGAIGTQLAESSAFTNQLATNATQRRNSISDINSFRSRTATISAGFGAASGFVGSIDPSIFKTQQVA